MRIVQVIPMVSAKNGKNNLHKFEMYFMKIGGATEVEGLVKPFDYSGESEPPFRCKVSHPDLRYKSRYLFLISAFVTIRP